MKIEQIKPGHTYYAPVEVVKIANGDVHVLPIQVYQPEELAYSPNPLRLVHADEKPKYNPCRLFRKGDIVEPTEINGRISQALRGCYRYKVIVGEGDMSNPLYVTVKPLLAANYKHLSEIHVNVVFLKLVTPVEELEPYSVKQNMHGRSYEVKSPTPVRTVAAFFYGGENPAYTEEKALAAAEAECARLNVAHRKEQA